MTKTHEKSGTKLHLVWITMRQRCNNPSSQRYSLYGKRGIKVCNEWEKDFMNFYNWAINNGYEEGLSIDRIDNDGDYTPSNCRWVTQREQANNTSRNTLITYKGKTQSLSDWARELDLNYNTLRSRRRLGWRPKEMFEMEMKGRGSNAHKINNERKRRELLSN